MTLFMWIVIALASPLCLLYVLTAYALYRGLGVKTGLKMPFATLSFETSGRENALPSEGKLPQLVEKSHGRSMTRRS
jgi:hypothetical protein